MTREILLNREVIAVDQDLLGVQGRRVAKNGTSEVWVKPLGGGAKAVLLFNRAAVTATIVADWSQLGYPASASVAIRDLWSHRSVHTIGGRIKATIEPHGVAMFRVAPRL